MSAEAMAQETADVTVASGHYRTLRIWIPIVLLGLMIFARFVPGLVEDGPSMIWMVAAFGPLLIGLFVVLWWLLLSRATWFERLLGLVGIVGIFTIVFALLDETMKGPTMPVMTIPLGIGGFALGAILCSRILNFRRTLIALLFGFLAAGSTALLRNDGVWGNFAFGLDWRWKPTAEEQFLAAKNESGESDQEPSVADAGAFVTPQWPGFRGPGRDGSQHGLRFSSDWESQPPEELWRIQLGPAWSSFAVAEPYLVTQEQRNDDECVVCYEAATGKQVWVHAQTSRFFEGLGGLGPRATPTIAGGKIYAMGAEGWLQCLDASNGELVWKVDIREAANCEPPMWGFSSSPAVFDDLVAVHTGNKQDKGIIALDTTSGDIRWTVDSGPQSYSSLQSVEIAGRKLLAILTDQGAQLIDPLQGKTVLIHEWQHQGYRALQPQFIAPDKMLIPTGMGTGTRMIEITESEGELASEEIWTSRNMKPDFNDLVVHNGYVYGFDDSIFACVDLSDGSRKWKRGRYGKGQALLLADSDAILVLSEQGELVLLKADPEEHKELGRIQAMQSKTWNHPLVVGDRLYVRNAEEAVCYRLATENEPQP